VNGTKGQALKASSDSGTLISGMRNISEVEMLEMFSKLARHMSSTCS
jgi:hypothetical protein